MLCCHMFENMIKSLYVLTEYTSNPVISLHLSICSSGSRGGAREGLSVLSKVKKEIVEGRKAGRAGQKNRAPNLAQGLDPPLICITEALLASAVRCRMISHSSHLYWPKS